MYYMYEFLHDNKRHSRGQRDILYSYRTFSNKTQIGTKVQICTFKQLCVHTRRVHNALFPKMVSKAIMKIMAEYGCQKFQPFLAALHFLLRTIWLPSKQTVSQGLPVGISETYCIMPRVFLVFFRYFEAHLLHAMLCFVNVTFICNQRSRGYLLCGGRLT